MFELVSGFKNLSLHKSSSSVHVLRIDRDGRELVDRDGDIDRCFGSHSSDLFGLTSVFLALVDFVFATFCVEQPIGSLFSTFFELVHPIFLSNSAKKHK